MTSYEMRKEWFTEVLENYHTIPAVDWKRLFIDRILEPAPIMMPLPHTQSIGC